MSRPFRTLVIQKRSGARVTRVEFEIGNQLVTYEADVEKLYKETGGPSSRRSVELSAEIFDRCFKEVERIPIHED